MDPLDVATRLLQAAPGEFYCATCLGEAAGLSRLVVQGIGCEGYDLVTMAIAYVPASKCARCSRHIRDGDPHIVVNGDWFIVSAGKSYGRMRGSPTRDRRRSCLGS